MLLLVLKLCYFHNTVRRYRDLITYKSCILLSASSSSISCSILVDFKGKLLLVGLFSYLSSTFYYPVFIGSCQSGTWPIAQVTFRSDDWPRLAMI